MKLYILGNGFDLHHELPTMVKDFKKILQVKDVNDYFITASVDWSEYEESLSFLEVEAMCEEFIEYPDYMSDYESDRYGVILEMENKMSKMKDIVDDALKEMVIIANEKIETDVKLPQNNKIFEDDSLIVSFNYTSTLEKLYNIDELNKIIHIHGCFEDGEELIFGYSEQLEEVLKFFAAHDVLKLDSKDKTNIDNIYEVENEYDYYVQEQYNAIYNFYQINQKKLRLDELSDEISPYHNKVEEIIVIGHSLGIVDKPYFELIESKLTPKKWVISYYEERPNYKFVEDYSFANKVEFIKTEVLIPLQ